MEFVLGKRIQEARRLRKLSQLQLARSMGNHARQMISRVECGHSTMSTGSLLAAARALDISVDYLYGLTDDPAPVDDRVDEAEARAREEARKRGQLETVLKRTEAERDRLRAQADPDVSPIQSAPGWRDEDYESVRRYESEDVALAAGTGTFADQEPVAGEVKFRTSWLRKRRLRAKDLFLVDVLGDSMERTIFHGDAALVDESRRSPRSGQVYALRAADGLLVKRLRKRDHRWWADSDNEEYEPQPLGDRARILGRVVWWAHTD